MKIDHGSKNIGHDLVKSRSRQVEVVLPTSTILKFLSAALICLAIYKLLPFLMLLFMSVLLAVTFAPLVTRLANWLGHRGAVLLTTVVLGGLILATMIVIVPLMAEQIGSLYQRIPEFTKELGERFPPIKYYVEMIPQKLNHVDTATVSPLLAHLATFGGVALGGASALAVIFAFQIYLLYDGARVYNWLVAFFKKDTREKIELTCDGISPIISAYVFGQIITSILCSTFTFILLNSVGVPAALVLAVLAGVFDVLPIIGFFLFAAPACLFALTVSLQAMLIVLGGFFVYHMIETYIICPLVYGNRLRVSGIVVLFSLIAGATIGGILGAIAVLPIVASYPTIEEIWLGKYLGRTVVRKHKEVEDEVEGESRQRGRDEPLPA